MFLKKCEVPVIRYCEERMYFDVPYTNIFSPLLKDIKRIEHVKWDTEKGIWYINKLTSSNKKQVGYISKKWEVPLSEEATEILQKEQIFSNLSKISSFPVINKNILSFQKEGVSFICENKQAILADEQGTGKTFQTISAIALINKLPILIICPSSVKYNWQKEINMWLPENNYKISVINANKANKKTYNEDFNADIVIINYDLVRIKDTVNNQRVFRYVDRLSKIKWSIVVVDESHYLGNSTSAQTKAVTQICKKSNPEYRLLLSGTPFMNNPVELVSQLRLLGIFEQLFNNKLSFQFTYCGARKGRFGIEYGTPNPEALFKLGKTLRETCMIRRRKKDVLLELPEKIVQDLYVDIDNEKEYEQCEKDFHKTVPDKEFLFIDNDIEKYEPEVKKNYLSHIENLRQICARGKINTIKEFADNILANGEKVVIFAHHRFLQDELRNIYPEAVCIFGSETAQSKQLLIDSFQKNDHKKICIISSSCCEGVTLTSASKMIICEFLWNPAKMNQLQDRLHRYGQKNNVIIYNLIANNTIESDSIFPILKRKQEIIGKVMENDTDFQINLDSIQNEILKSYLSYKK